MMQCLFVYVGLNNNQESVLARPLQKNSAKIVIRFLFQFDYQFSKKNELHKN